MIKLSVIGVGKMGALHLDKFSRLPQVVLAGFYDLNDGHSSAALASYPVKRFADLNRLFLESDAVVIASPSDTHAEYGLRALRAGLHVLVEKPMTLDIASAERLVATAQDNRRVLAVGLLERFRLLSFTSALSQAHRLQINRMNVAPGREKGIDVIHDLMVHDLDLIQSLVGEALPFVRVHLAKEINGVWEEVEVSLSFEGKEVRLRASRIAKEPQRSLVAELASRTLQIDFLKQDSLTNSANHSAAAWAQDALSLQATDFVSAIETGRPPLVSGQDGVRGLRLVHLILDAVEKQKLPRPTQQDLEQRKEPN